LHSLSDDDIQNWIARSETLLNEHPPGTTLSKDEVPDDLRELGITRIDIWQDDVLIQYTWAVFTRTSLRVQRLSEGNYKVIAVFDKENQKQLWPKENVKH